MDTAGGFFGELIEKGQNTTNTTVSDLSTSVQGQIGVKREPKAATNNQRSQTVPQNQQTSLEPSQSLDDAGERERVQEMVQDFYAPSDSTLKAQSNQDDLDAQQKLVRSRAELQKLFQNRHDEEYFIPFQQKSVPHDKPQSDGQQEAPGPQVPQAKPMSELGTLGSIESRPKGIDRPSFLAARRAMTRVEQPIGTIG